MIEFIKVKEKYHVYLCNRFCCYVGMIKNQTSLFGCYENSVLSIQEAEEILDCMRRFGNDYVVSPVEFSLIYFIDSYTKKYRVDSDDVYLGGIHFYEGEASLLLGFDNLNKSQLKKMIEFAKNMEGSFSLLNWKKYGF